MTVPFTTDDDDDGGNDNNMGPVLKSTGPMYFIYCYKNSMESQQQQSKKLWLSYSHEITIVGLAADDLLSNTITNFPLVAADVWIDF